MIKRAVFLLCALRKRNRNGSVPHSSRASFGSLLFVFVIIRLKSELDRYPAVLRRKIADNERAAIRRRRDRLDRNRRNGVFVQNSRFKTLDEGCQGFPDL